MSRAVTAAWTGVTTLVGRMPGTLNATTAGARGAASALQTLPDPTLRWLAAGSLGLGAGFFLTGKPRLIIAAGVAPALAIGAAMIARPVEPVVPAGIVPVSALGPRGAGLGGVEWDPARSQRDEKRG